MKFSLKPIGTFFNTEYINWASYDNLRKIGSVVDGQKNAARKVLWYILNKNIKNEVKVSQLDSKVAEYTEYLHGSMAGVIVNLAKDYSGTNNINLLFPEGNFGTRLIPEASAPRYIYTYGSKEFFEMFNTTDKPILQKQIFEGNEIEPKFLLPKLPLLLINGSEGLSSGFAQKILPRNPNEIKKYIEYYLKNPNAPKKPFQNKPYFKGFKGKVKGVQDKWNQWEILGDFTIRGNKVIINELPIGYSLKSYIKILDKLEEQNKIQRYKDFSNEEFKFEVVFKKDVLKGLSEDELFDYLRLKKKVTENYTVMTENNKIKVHSTLNDVLWHYIDVKMEYLQKRKEHLISSLVQGIKQDVSKYLFIKAVVEGQIDIMNRPEAEIINDIKRIKNVIPIDGSYDYLLNIPVKSLTKERYQKLLNDIMSKKEDLKVTKITSLEDMWLKDLG